MKKILAQMTTVAATGVLAVSMAYAGQVVDHFEHANGTETTVVHQNSSVQGTEVSNHWEHANGTETTVNHMQSVEHVNHSGPVTHTFVHANGTVTTVVRDGAGQPVAERIQD